MGRLLPVLKGDPRHLGHPPRTAGPAPTLHAAGRGGALWYGSAPPGLYLTHRHTNATHMHMIPHTRLPPACRLAHWGVQFTFSGSHRGCSWGLEGSGRATDRARPCPSHSLTVRWTPDGRGSPWGAVTPRLPTPSQHPAAGSRGVNTAWAQQPCLSLKAKHSSFPPRCFLSLLPLNKTPTRSFSF